MRKKRATGGSCPRQEKLVAYGDNTLDDENEERIRTHIEHCDKCLERFLELMPTIPKRLRK